MANPESPREWVKNENLGEKYCRVRHKSGLTVYVFPKETTSTYALFATKYGSLDRTFRVGGDDFLTVPDGIAHFLEHKLFEEEDGSDVFSKFAALGASANAYTSNEMTAYLFSATDHVPEALRTLLSFVTHPYFTDENVQKEQGIIAQEIGMYDDNPSARLYYALLEGLYRNHNVRINIAGTVKTIAEITPELLYRCYRTFYHPSNMALAVCGRVDVEEVLAAVDDVLPDETEPVVIERKYPVEDASLYKKHTVLHMEVGKPLFAFGVKDLATFDDPKERAKHGIALDLFNDLLFSESTSFYTELYEKGLISDSFSAEYEWMNSCAFNAVSGESDRPEEVLAAVEKRIAACKTKPPAKEDFERLKKTVYADYIRSFESAESIASELIHGAFHGVDFLTLGDVIRSVSYDDILALAENYYEGKEIASVTILPVQK